MVQKVNQTQFMNSREQDVLHVRGFPDHAAPPGVRHLDSLPGPRHLLQGAGELGI